MISLKKILNTYAPIPIAYRAGSIRMGSKSIIAADADPWRKSICQKPEDYIMMSDRSKQTLDLLLSTLRSDESVIDVGCNVGRVCNELQKSGHPPELIHGFDVMEAAEVQRKINFPDLLPENFFTGDIYQWSQQNTKYDVAVIVTAVIELIHPSFNVFKCFRNKGITKVVLSLCEDLHRYPRYYKYLAKREGYIVSSVTNIDSEAELLFLELEVK